MKSPMMTAALSTMLLTMLLLSPGYSADDKAKADKDKETKEVKKEAASEESTPKVQLRLPALFGKLGLSEPQKEAVLKAQAKYGEKIGALQREIEKLKEEQKAEVREILNRDQKAELDKLNAERAKSKAAADKLAADNEESAKKKPAKKKTADQEEKLKEKKEKKDEKSEEKK